MTLRDEWVRHCYRLASKPGDFYSGCRKIHRARILSFYEFDDSLKMEDAGFTSNKMRYLERNYRHEESITMAVSLWERRRDQEKYGSVGFTCYNHLIKADPTKQSKRASVMGPCMQAVTLTLLDKKRVGIDVFYRTTELFKKFPADLVFLRDVLLKPFDLEGLTIEEVNCHFANITIHPMYAVTTFPLLPDPLATLEHLKKKDKYFFEWSVKWSARFICPEYHRGIAKFAQALRVHKDANERIHPKTLRKLQDYLRDNHPGHRNSYVDPEENDD